MTYTQAEQPIIKNTKAFNRGFGYVIESLSNLTRFDLADDNHKEVYLNHFKEAYRVVRKVGTKDDLKAMGEIKKELKNKGYDL